MDELISRQAAIDIVTPHDDNRAMRDALEELPPAQPGQDREFIKLVRNSNGRPYYSIIYLEFDDNGVGHDFEGYSSYSLDVISDYLKKYFMPPAKPERIRGRWNEISSSNHTYKCSVCGRLLVNIMDGKNNVAKNYPYCHCGADMRGEQDE